MKRPKETRKWCYEQNLSTNPKPVRAVGDVFPCITPPYRYKFWLMDQMWLNLQLKTVRSWSNLKANYFCFFSFEKCLFFSWGSKADTQNGACPKAFIISVFKNSWKKVLVVDMFRRILLEIEVSVETCQGTAKPFSTNVLYMRTFYQLEWDLSNLVNQLLEKLRSLISVIKTLKKKYLCLAHVCVFLPFLTLLNHQSLPLKRWQTWGPQPFSFSTLTFSLAVSLLTSDLPDLRPQEVCLWRPLTWVRSAPTRGAFSVTTKASSTLSTTAQSPPQCFTLWASPCPLAA